MKLNVILLASGASRRFGSNKLQYYLDGYPLYMHPVWQVMQLLEMPEGAAVQEVLLITKYEVMAEALKAYGITTWYNDNSHEGISASVRLGTKHSQAADAYLFSVCDQPWLRAASLAQLISTYQNSQKGIASLAYRGQSGNPCIFSARYRQELLALKGDRGGRQIMKQHPEDLAVCQIASGQELQDVDTRAQLKG